jgi:hypothetical protein
VKSPRFDFARFAAHEFAALSAARRFR